MKITLKETDYKVQVNDNISDKLKVSKGLKQRDPLPTTLFNIVPDEAVKELDANKQNSIQSAVEYVDDVVILTRNK